MQITEHKKKDIIIVGKKANKFKPNILYFADSLGSMDDKKVSEIIKNFRTYWNGEIGSMPMII